MIPSKSVIITAGTDGFIALWLLPYPSKVLNVSPTNDTEPTPEPACPHLVRRYKLHQSTIKSMAIVSTSQDIVLVTSGDDNALAFTRIEINQCESAQIAFSTLLIPSAHASAINAVQTIHEDHSSDVTKGTSGSSMFLLLTTGNDQRIKRWSVKLELERPGVEAIHVKMVSNNASSVADASCMASISGNSSRAVAIAGVGIEVWKV